MGSTQSFSDIFKSGFLQSITMDISVADIFATLCISLVLGLIIALVYRYSFQGVVYSHSFNVTLLGMIIITAAIIRTISSNILLSLGMVGALSIVRFRSAIKDPKDIMYIFWSIAMGIACGAGLYLFAIIATLFIGLVLFLATKIRAGKKSYLMVLRYDYAAHPEILRILNKIKHDVKSRVVSGEIIEMTIELHLFSKVDQTGFISMFYGIKGVEHATLVHYNGDYAE